MLLWYDPTESRVGSRLPTNVINIGVSLPKLEAKTGADLLISPLHGPPLVELNRPGIEILKVHCQAGVLVQRKSGMDFVSSIGRLAGIQWRMQQWGLSWLLVTGNIGSGKNGLAYIDGHRSHVSYHGLVGALDYWQLRGGGVSILRSDALSGKWFQLMCERVERVHKEPEIEIEMLRQVLVKKRGSARENAATQTLSTFPGIGAGLARNIAVKYKSLAEGLVFLSGEEKMKGVGLTTKKKAQEWLGLDKNERLKIEDKGD